MKIKILILVFVLVILGGGAYVYNNILQQNKAVEETKETLSNSDIRQKLQKTSSTTAAHIDRADKALELLSSGSVTDKEQEAFLKIVFANNNLEKTAPGTDEMRKQAVMTSYKTLFEVVNNNEYSPTARGTAMQGISYIYLESCSIDEWFTEAVSLYDPATYQKFATGSSTQKTQLAETFDTHYQKEALSLVKSYYNQMNLAVSLLSSITNKTPATEKEALLRQADALYKDYKNNGNSKGFYDSNAFFAGRKLELELRYLITLNKLKPSADLKKQIPEIGYAHITEIAKESYASPGQKLTESFLRIRLGAFLFDTYGASRNKEIATLLRPIYQPETIPHIQGVIFGLKSNENTSQVLKSIKQYSQGDKELKTFLMGIGWKY
jgi:hypothetical protein